MEQVMKLLIAKGREFHEEMKTEIRTNQAKTDAALKEMETNQRELTEDGGLCGKTGGQSRKV
jgi:hypothetical protein